ncbi:MAG: MFS transporter [Gemmatimonadetes bacterium]|nr:MFS transporter [Gemmatimonadota bacterium]
MILNVLPLFLANVLGVRVWAVGAVEGLADTTAAVVKLYSGWLSDRVGKRKWLAVAGYAISSAVKPLYLLAGSWAAVAGIRWGDRIGKGVRTAPRDALLADSSVRARRGLVFGIHRAADTAGAVVGLLITVLVVRRVQAGEALLTAETFRTLVLWSVVPAVLAVLVLAFGATDVAGSVADESRVPRVRLRGLGREFGWFVACATLFQLGNSADAFLVLRAQERGLSLTDILWVLLAFNVVYAAVAAPAGSLSDRIGRKRMLLLSWVLYSLCYLGFASARTGSHIAALYLPYAVYHGMSAGAAKALVADLVPAELRALAYGGYAAAVGLIALPASLLAGILWDGIGGWTGFGPQAPFLFGSGTAVLASMLLHLTVPEGARES